MKCSVIAWYPGMQAIVCGSRAPRRRCSVPGCTNWATKQCDFPVVHAKKKTCDAYICDRCAKSVGPDRDHCPPHAKQAQLPGVPANQTKGETE